MWGNSSLYPFCMSLCSQNQLNGGNRKAPKLFWVLIHIYFSSLSLTERHLTWTHVAAWVRAILYPASRWPLPSGGVTDLGTAGYWASCPTSWVIHPGWGLYDLMEHRAHHFWPPPCLYLHVWPLAHFAYMYAFERYMICSSCAWIRNKSWSTLEKYSITVSVLNGEAFHLYIKLNYITSLNTLTRKMEHREDFKATVHPKQAPFLDCHKHLSYGFRFLKNC